MKDTGYWLGRGFPTVQKFEVWVSLIWSSTNIRLFRDSWSLRLYLVCSHCFFWCLAQGIPRFFFKHDLTEKKCRVVTLNSQRPEVYQGNLQVVHGIFICQYQMAQDWKTVVTRVTCTKNPLKSTGKMPPSRLQAEGPFFFLSSLSLSHLLCPNEVNWDKYT